MQFARPITVTSAGTPAYLSNEVVWRQSPKVTLYDSDEKMRDDMFANGLVIISNYRLIWIARDRKNAKCWHLADVSSISQESAGWFQGSEKMIVYFEKGGSEKYLKIKFGDGGTDKCVEVTKRALAKKSWVQLEKERRKRADPSKLSPGSSERRTFNVGGGGIGALIRNQKKEADRAKKVTSAAFKDLDSLMENAKKVVAIAEKYAARMQRAATSGDGKSDSAAQFSSLVRTVGLTSPVTRQAVGDDLYVSELARQLAGFLKSPLEEAGGMLMLVSIYGLYNRARGTDLISPDDLLAACELLRRLHLKMSLRKFDSGVLVVQLDSHSDDEIVKRIVAVTQDGPTSPTDISEKWKISVIIAKEHLLVAEKHGAVCRDDSIEGLYFYANLFLAK